MKKRIISLFLVLAVSLSMFCPLAFADDSSTHEHDWSSGIISEFSDTVEGIPVSVSVKKCTKCNFYKHTYKFFGLSFDFYNVTAYTGIVEDFLLDVTLHISSALGKNASAKQYETGGGSGEGSSGVGRRPSGYSENNTPNVTQAGQMHFYVPVTGWTRTIYSTTNCRFWSSDRITDLEVPSANASGTLFPSNYSSDSYVIAVCAFTAPVSGTYSVLPGTTIAKYRYIRSNTWYTAVYTSKSATGSYAKGDSAWLVALAGVMPSTYPYDAEGYGVDIYVTPLESTIKQTNNITINNNTWNGNIYQDNSTNLTYIYPQYTTINENNETVTNISNNPIIYNNETKQYYTYDTVTNNYYYITYEAPTPSPSPSPDPTPTPEPGGDAGDISGLLDVLVQIRDNMIQGFADIKATLVQGWADLSANFTLAIENLNLNITNIFNKKFPDQSTPETAEPSPSPSPSPSPEPSPSPTPDPGETPTPTPAPTDKPSNGNTNNFWNFVFPGGSDDGTENGHKGILWALISLLIAVVTFVLGLGSAYSYVFPFLPAGLVTTIHICVLVLLLFAIIKFVRSFL